MILRRILPVVFAWGCGLLALTASTSIMPVEDIRPGMTGVGRTVFQGTTIEEFKVLILGVLRNTMGPRRDLILARLEGGPLAKSGVIAGMSGSPVYIDGRLVGALSYALGQFSTEPIAGITPFGEMVEATAVSVPRAAAARLRWDGTLTPVAMVAAVRRALGVASPFAQRASEVTPLGTLADGAYPRLGTLLRPIATPLMIAGYDRSAMEPLLAAFEDRGFLPVSGASMPGGGQEKAPPQQAPLRPGDAIGVSLVDGDLVMGATGTVTEVDGQRVYAFGHPLYNIGPTRFPMTRAYVHTILPSLLSSSKLSSTGDVIGTIVQDRATAIAGTLGPPPSRVQVRLSLETERGLRKSFRFALADDQLLTPLLLYASLANIMGAYEREFGAATFTVTGHGTLQQGGRLEFNNVFTGDSPGVAAAASVAMPIAAVLSNDLEPAKVDSIDLTVTTSERPRIATIERVWIDAVDIRAGRTVPLKVLLRSYRGDTTVKTFQIDLPSNARGPLSILVSDGNRLTQWEQRDVRQALEPEALAQLVQQMNRQRRNNRLYVRLVSQETGAVVAGEYLPSLPASALAVYEADRGATNMASLRFAVLGAWEVAMDEAVTGMRVLTLSLNPSE
jgi:hypothetical protein